MVEWVILIHLDIAQFLTISVRCRNERPTTSITAYQQDTLNVFVSLNVKVFNNEGI